MRNLPLVPVVLLAASLGLCACSSQAGQTEDPAGEPAPQEEPATPQDPAEDETLADQDQNDSSAHDAAKEAALEGLSQRLEDMREELVVYRDFSDSENHYSQRMMMFGTSPSAARPLDENWTDNPHSGTSCIRCEHATGAKSWSGWMFLNGYVPEGATEPRVNDDSPASRGLDLTGATELRFWARGEKGGEIANFFCAGFGYEGDTPIRLQENADSAASKTHHDLFLSTRWEEYSIPLRDMDLSNIACGFGYAVDDNNYQGEDVVFYLDDIRFVGSIDSLQDAPMLMRSYDTDTLETKNAAFTYDNAVAAMAFLSEGRTEEAAELLDAFVYAIEHDRFEPGRIRNAYAAGEIVPPAGWGTGAKLPGWYDLDAKAWYEDAYQVGSNVGNTSYAALALMHYAAEVDDPARARRYLGCAEQLMGWVLDDCSDGRDGFLAGYDGWPENGNGGATVHSYKSCEHNIDAYAAFAQLARMTDDPRYEEAAQSALRFVESMYDPSDRLFYTGTQADSVTADHSNTVLDTQVWTALALGDDFAPYEDALASLDDMRTSAGGYRFHVCDEDAYWCEGTAFTALMHRLRGEDDAAEAALGALESVQLESGLFPAATDEGLTTGIYLSDGSPWLYGTDAHVAPTAWFVMACNGYNPYRFAPLA